MCAHFVLYICVISRTFVIKVINALNRYDFVIFLFMCLVKTQLCSLKELFCWSNGKYVNWTFDIWREHKSHRTSVMMDKELDIH